MADHAGRRQLGGLGGQLLETPTTEHKKETPVSAGRRSTRTTELHSGGGGCVLEGSWFIRCTGADYQWVLVYGPHNLCLFFMR